MPIQFTSAMPITKYSSVILNKLAFYPPFSLIHVGRIAFSSLGSCKIEWLLQNHQSFIL
jgi:hypothetical protein